MILTIIQIQVARTSLRDPLLHHKIIKMATIAPKQVPVIYFGIISLDSEFQLSTSSNNSVMDKSYSSNFYYQEGSSATVKYSVMLADHYGSIDTSNTNICPVVIISWQSILKQQYIALNSLLTTLPCRNFHWEGHSRHVLYCSRIRKM